MLGFRPSARPGDLTMSVTSTFNEQILADKMSKINSTQQCVESILFNLIESAFQFSAWLNWIGMWVLGILKCLIACVHWCCYSLNLNYYLSVWKLFRIGWYLAVEAFRMWFFSARLNLIRMSVLGIWKPFLACMHWCCNWLNLNYCLCGREVFWIRLVFCSRGNAI